MKRLLYILPLLLLLPFGGSGQVITNFAGTGSSVFSGVGVPALTAGIPNPAGGFFDANGYFFFADPVVHRVREINSAGIINTIAGTGTGGFSGDGGSASTANLKGPAAARLDSYGNIYIADAQNHRIRKIDKATSIITTIAGNGSPGYSGDGAAAVDAMLWGIQDICVDKYGNVYIADAFNYRVRKVTPAGIISTFAGNGTPGYSGEGVLADTSRIGAISGLCADTAGNIYIGDNSGSRVMKVNSAGIMTTFAGNGSPVYAGDGIPATSASIGVLQIAISREGDLFIADRYNNRAHKVDHLTGLLHCVAGNGVPGDAGDGGLATAASLHLPVSVALDQCGNLYISTIGSASTTGLGRRIRKVTFNPPTTAAVTITGITTAAIGATVTVTAAVSGAGGAYSIKWFNKGVQFAATTTPTVTFTKANTIDSITARIVPAITYCYDSAMSNLHIVTKSTTDLSLLPSVTLHIYPNPAHNEVVITGNDIDDVWLVNMLGQVLVWGNDNKSNIHLNIAEVPAGVYIVRVRMNGGSVVLKKVIKE
ncbi:MAG: T9SS type A sorting domain-containing protein [Bacteroidota bacterium]